MTALTQLTVAKLIEKLQQHDPDALVHMEGCDCYQEAADVEVLDLPHDPGTHVLILNTEE